MRKLTYDVVEDDDDDDNVYEDDNYDDDNYNNDNSGDDDDLYKLFIFFFGIEQLRGHNLCIYCSYIIICVLWASGLYLRVINKL